MRRVFTAMSMAMLTAAAMFTASAPAAGAAPNTASAASSSADVPSSVDAAEVQAAATLWHCLVDYWRTCTRITSAPSSGVVVYDRVDKRLHTLFNTNSVFLYGWYRDTSGKCGINGDPYVWSIGWKDSRGYHSAIIGDYYLATGGTSTWKPFPVTPGSSVTWAEEFRGYGTGTCDRFPRG